MGKGVRLHHPDLRNCTIAVAHPERRYPEPWFCPRCQLYHEFKTYHLEIDSVGDVVVEETVIFAKLEAIGFAGFAAMGVVAKPETQRIGFDAVKVGGVLQIGEGS